MADPTASDALGTSYQELSGVLYQELRRCIVVGEFEPGARLLEARLAERFAVSRGPVRVALAELERVGLVTSETRRGTYVATFSGTDIDELFDLTSTLERLAAREAAIHATSEQVETLNRLLNALGDTQASGDAAQTVEADLELHRHLVEASGNRRLLRVWLEISEQIRFVIGITQRNLPDVRWELYNKPIIDAVTRHDPQAAADAVEAAFEEAHAKIRMNSSRAFDLTRRRARTSRSEPPG